MKYVFFIHSHTVLLTSLGVIDFLKIDVKDIIFLCTRNYTSYFFKEGARIIRADECEKLCEEIVCSSDKLFIKTKIKQVDSLISNWIQDKYELFVPHLCGGLLSLLYTHNLCCRVSYLQEGAHVSSGFFVSNLSLFKKWKRKINLYRQYGNTRFYCNTWYVDGVLKNNEELNAYSIYEEYFKYLPCKQNIISWPIIKIDSQVNINGPVFVFDGYVNLGLSDKDYYLKQCDKMINRFHGEMNFIKFHPAQSEEECMCIENIFRKYDAKYRVLDPLIPFELYIINIENMTVVGMGSSLLFFAYKKGHNVICCDSWMMGAEGFKIIHDQGYALFHEYFTDAKEIKE